MGLRLSASRREPRHPALRPDRAFPPAPLGLGVFGLCRRPRPGWRFGFVVRPHRASAFLRPLAPRSGLASRLRRALGLLPGGASGHLFSGREHRLSPTGFPEDLAGPSGHGVSTPGTTPGDRPADRRCGCAPLAGGPASPLARRLARPGRPNRVHRGCPAGSRRSGRVVLVPWLAPRHAATQGQFETARRFAAREPTCPALAQRPLRRTRADIPVGFGAFVNRWPTRMSALRKK